MTDIKHLIFKTFRLMELNAKIDLAKQAGYTMVLHNHTVYSVSDKTALFEYDV